MSKQALRLVALIVFCFAIPLLAQEEPAPPDQGSGSPTSSPGDRCNGGQCVTIVGAQPVTLNCPTSGGPICAPGQGCGCVCKGGINGVSAVNQCLTTSPSGGTPEEGPN